jgi:hypothetical protein
MKTSTTAYSIPPEMIWEIRANPAKLEQLFGFNDRHNPDWRVAGFNFPKSWQKTVEILNAGGFEKAWEKLNTENFLDFEKRQVWTATPSAVKSATKELEAAKFGKISISDFQKTFENQEIYKVFSEIQQMKEFFKNTAE